MCILRCGVIGCSQKAWGSLFHITHCWQSTWQNNLRKEGCSLRILSIVVGKWKPWEQIYLGCQESDAASRLFRKSGTWEKNIGVQMTSHFIISITLTSKAQAVDPPTFSEYLCSSDNPFWKWYQSHTQRYVSWVIPNLVTLSIKINHLTYVCYKQNVMWV